MVTVPEGTFISNYMKYMEDQETPRMYDFMMGAWCLSNVLGRHCIVDRPRAPVHLNMYVILVSESGIMRKSSSIRVATGFLREFLRRNNITVSLIESRVSMGELLHELSLSTREHNKAHLVLIASELAASFGRAGGIGNVVALLTDLYDCPDVQTGAANAINKRPSYNLQHVYSSFLAGSTPSWLSKTVTPTIIEGGFTSRCYFVLGKQRKRSIAWPNPIANADAREVLLKQLGDIYAESQSYSRINITDRAKNTFAEWYDRRTLHRDVYRESFESREDAHVLRFAGLFAANERSWLVNENHVRRAIEFVGDVKDYGTQLFTGVKVKTADLKWIGKIRDVLIKAGEAGVTRANLSRRCNPVGARTGELRSTLHVMHELDLIEVHEVSYEATRGRPATIYKATEYLKNEMFMDDVVRKLGLEA